jgi:glycerol-3-phosphate dehydrogenase
MAEDVVNTAAIHASLAFTESVTRELAIHGSKDNGDFSSPGYYYGSDMPMLAEIMNEHPDFSKPLHKAFPYTAADIIWAVRNEYCMTIEDALSRRTRALFLDAAASLELAPRVAEIMAAEMKLDQNWQENQVRMFNAVAQQYLPKL